MLLIKLPQCRAACCQQRQPTRERACVATFPAVSGGPYACMCTCSYQNDGKELRHAKGIIVLRAQARKRESSTGTAQTTAR